MRARGRAFSGAGCLLLAASPAAAQTLPALPAYLLTGDYQHSLGWQLAAAGASSRLVTGFSPTHPSATLLTQIRHVDADRTGALRVANSTPGHPGGGKFLAMALARQEMMGFALPSTTFSPPAHPGSRDISTYAGTESKVASELTPRSRFGSYRHVDQGVTTTWPPFPGPPATPQHRSQFINFAFGQRSSSTGGQFVYDISGDASILTASAGLTPVASFPTSPEQVASLGGWVAACAIPQENATGTSTQYFTTADTLGAGGAIVSYYGQGSQRLTDTSSQGTRCAGNAVSQPGAGSALWRFMLTTQAKVMFQPTNKGYLWLRVPLAFDLSKGYGNAWHTPRGQTARVQGWPSATTEVSQLHFCTTAAGTEDCLTVSLPSFYNVGTLAANSTSASGATRVWAQGSATAGYAYIDVPWQDTLTGYQTFAVGIAHSAAGRAAATVFGIVCALLATL